MTTFLARLFYFGDEFHGSQYQPGLRTVQGELISAISHWSGENHDTTTVRLSGRTDRGVHSIGQIVMVQTKVPFSITGINKCLPSDIALWAFRPISIDFNPRIDVLARYYRYYLPLRDDLDTSIMNQAAQTLIGFHDFKFLSKRDGNRPTITTIFNVLVRNVKQSVMIEVYGTNFLWKLVRNIVSLLTLVGLHKIRLSDVSTIVHAQSRLSSGIRPAAPEALFLMESLVPFYFIFDKYGIRRVVKSLTKRMSYLQRSLVAFTSLYDGIGKMLTQA